MGENGSERISWGLIFQSSSLTARATFKFAQEQRTRRVQLHVGLRKGSPGEVTCTQSLHLEALWMGEKGSRHISWGLIFHSSPMTARATFRFAKEQRTRRVQLHVGLRKGSPGEFSCTQSLPLGVLLDGRKGLAMRFLGPDFSVVFDAG